jgi:hypothetical protein
MSYRKMLYKLIKNPSTNSWFCTYMINKNKHYFMCFLFINSMLQFKSNLAAGHTCLIKKPTKSLSDSNDVRSAASLVCFYILHINGGVMKDKVQS